MVMGFDDFGRQATKNNRRLQNNLRRGFRTKKYISPSFEKIVDQRSKEEIELRASKFKKIEHAAKKQTLIELILMFVVGFIFFFIWYF